MLHILNPCASNLISSLFWPIKLMGLILCNKTTSYFDILLGGRGSMRTFYQAPLFALHHRCPITSDSPILSLNALANSLQMSLVRF